MFLPIGDAPNPKGVPFVTYALIAANVAVFLLFNVPLGSQRADVGDPAFREYVQVMSQELGDRAELQQLVARTSEFDLFTFAHGYRPASPQLVRPAELHVPARRLHAPVRQHALPLDLRRQRRAAPRGDPVPPRVPRDRGRGDARARRRLRELRDASRRRLGRHLGRPGLLLRALPAQQRPHARLPAAVPDAGLHAAGALGARGVRRLRQPAALPLRGRGRRRARGAPRRLPRGRRHGLVRRSAGCSPGGPRRSRWTRGPRRAQGVRAALDAGSLRRSRAELLRPAGVVRSRGRLAARGGRARRLAARERPAPTRRSRCCAASSAIRTRAKGSPRPTRSPAPSCCRTCASRRRRTSTCSRRSSWSPTPPRGREVRGSPRRDRGAPEAARRTAALADRLVERASRCILRPRRPCHTTTSCAWRSTRRGAPAIWARCRWAPSSSPTARSSAPGSTSRSAASTRPRTRRSSPCAPRPSALGNYRLPGTVLYVTVEPCLMCVGAIVHARVATRRLRRRRPEGRRRAVAARSGSAPAEPSLRGDRGRAPGGVPRAAAGVLPLPAGLALARDPAGGAYDRTAWVMIGGCRGEVRERLNRAVSKTVVPKRYRGFESHPLRQILRLRLRFGPCARVATERGRRRVWGREQPPDPRRRDARVVESA